MRILLTNDDGFDGEGLTVLASVLHKNKSQHFREKHLVITPLVLAVIDKEALERWLK